MMNQFDQRVLVEELFFVPDSEISQVEPIHIRAVINLNEFNFTESEIEKIDRLTRRLELALLTEFNKFFSAASVIVEVRSNDR